MSCPEDLKNIHKKILQGFINLNSPQECPIFITQAVGIAGKLPGGSLVLIKQAASIKTQVCLGGKRSWGLTGQVSNCWTLVQEGADAEGSYKILPPGLGDGLARLKASSCKLCDQGLVPRTHIRSQTWC